MPSPFPGMDPYIESQGLWPEFHTVLITYCRAALNAVLPDGYAATVEGEIRLVDLSDDPPSRGRPDVLLIREDRDRPAFPANEPGGVVTLEPVTIPLDQPFLEEVMERWIEIKRLPDLELVTAVEILSPTNKVSPGRSEYLAKRHRLLDRPIGLVEIDLLRGGRRLPMRGPLPPGDCYAIVSRADRRPDSDVYAWSIRRPLPTIPIPLAPPDADVPLDLAPLAARAYDEGRYARLIRYDRPLDPPLSADDRAWGDELARAAARPTTR